MFKPGQVFVLFLKRSGLFLLMMSLSRLIFYVLNSNYFPEFYFSDFIQGIRFDALAAVFGLAPFLIFHLWPFSFFTEKSVQQALKVYYFLVLGIYLAVNCIDTIYYRFTLKRTTWDIFHYVSTGDDTASLIPQFLSDYWYMILIFLGMMYLAWFLFRRIISSVEVGTIRNQWPYVIISLVLIVLASRGGYQLKPLHIIDASRYTMQANVPLVLNTPFTLLKTIESKPLSEVHYLSPEEAEAWFNPEWHNRADSSPVRRNVVIIIMESLAKEYIGYYNQGDGFTPFLDSLMEHALVFTNAYANGRRSIEALPAIFSGLPNLMNEAYITSVYGGNRLSSLASLLKQQGYESCFFHGGKNGTMGFNSYTKLAGVDHYFGMDEYPDSDDFDGSWGVFDVPYFSYVAETQNALPRPFLCGMFSLSSHHPYALPEGTQLDCPEGSLPIHPTICYADQALRTYFNKVKEMPWYNETVFLITADHTAQSVKKEYGNSMGIYAIPIILFDPGKGLTGEIAKTTQQADIPPTILDHLGLESRMICFGQSALDTTSEGFAVNYLQDVYQIIDDENMLQFDGNHVIGGVKYRKNSALTHNDYKSDPGAFRETELRLKALIQSYNQRMINNELTVNE